MKKRLELSAVALLTCLAAGTSASAGVLSLDTPQKNLAAMRRIQCSLTDGEVYTFYWKGDVYSRVPGEPDRHLLGLEGMSIRQCGALPGTTDGSYRMATREIILYQDPVTRQLLSTWENPWTGKRVEVMQVANDPMSHSMTATDRGGRPFDMGLVENGGQWWHTLTLRPYYPSVLGGDYQTNVGGYFHTTEMFSLFGDVRELADPKRKAVSARVSYVYIGRWMPWMEMGDRAGLIYTNSAGRKLERFEDLPASFREVIASRYPEWARPPPLDDPRPNASTWINFKKWKTDKAQGAN